MKTILTTLIFLLIGGFSFGQMSDGKFGNEWINYQNTYYKFKISEDGLYRIPSSHLTMSGVDLSKLTQTNIQLFLNGQEIPINVQMDGETIDYIEFWGQKNKSTLDKELYNNGHFNPEYSLITDSSSYFLTWDNSINGKRYQNISSNLTNLPQRENYFISEVVALPNLIWSVGKEYPIAGINFSRSSFEYGEGYGSQPSTNQSITLNTPYFIQNTIKPSVEVRMYSQGFNHNVEYSISNQPIHNMLYYGDTIITTQIELQTLQQTTTLSVRGLDNSSDKHSISYVKVKYPRSFNFEGNSTYKFNISAGGRKFLEIDNFDGMLNQVYLFDITNGVRIHCMYDVNTQKVLTDLPTSSVDRELVLITLSNTKLVGKVEKVNFTNYQNYNGDYVMIAHSKMFNDVYGDNPLIEWAAYRSSEHNPVIINVQEIFDQFGYGIDLHPQSIRNFSDYILTHWDNPKHVFLIGKAKEYNQVRNFNTYDVQIPTFGYPGSDNMLFTKKGQTTPSLSVGRLSVTNGDEFRVYMNKIIEMETYKSSTDNSWNDNVLHLSGGDNVSEQQMFANVLNTLGDSLENGEFNVTSFHKENFNLTNSNNDSTLNSTLNKGVSIMTYLGHASETAIDFELNKIERYNNKYKYPLFMSLSCSSGNIFNSSQDMSETLVLSPDRGVSAFLGFSKPVSLFSANSFATEFYNILSNQVTNKTNGELIKIAMSSLSNSGLLNELASDYLIYHGDPALKITHSQNINEDTIQQQILLSSVEKFETTSEIYNYPNPVKDCTTFVINLGNEFSETEELLIEVFDIKGTILKTIKLNNNDGFGKFVSEKWDGMSEFSSGVYFYNIVCRNNKGEMKSINSKSILHKI